MSAFFQPGQELDEDGLKIFFEDNSGNPLTTLTVRYSIYQITSSETITIPDQYHQTATASVGTPGKYWAEWTVPSGFPTGSYQVRWDYRLLATDPWQQRRSSFAIVILPVGTSRTAEVTDLPGEPICVVL